MNDEYVKSSKRTRRATGGDEVERAFEPATWSKAGAIASRYRLMLEREEAEAGKEEEHRFLARAVEFPTVFASGVTPNECEAKIREMLTVVVATMLEVGEAPPLPASKRRVQVNIRLSEDEKTVLEEASQRAGFRGMSELVRYAALAWVRGAQRG